MCVSNCQCDSDINKKTKTQISVWLAKIFHLMSHLTWLRDWTIYLVACVIYADCISYKLGQYNCLICIGSKPTSFHKNSAFDME